MKIKLISIMAFIMYHIVFVTLHYVKNYEFIVYIFSAIMFIWLTLKIRYFTNKRYRKFNIILLIFCICIVISSLYNKMNFHRGFIYSIKILEVFLFWEYVYQKKKQKNVIRVFLGLTFFYAMINDIFLLVEPSLFTSKKVYLLGNKFYASYLHIVLIVMYMYYNKNNNLVSYCIKWILIVWSIGISMITECNTALVGCILIVIYNLALKRKIIKCNLSNPKNIIIVIVTSCTILIAFSGILNFKPVKYFIVNVLHEDLTLTGRMNIYENEIDIISEKFLLGYGYGNSYDILFDRINAPNTQNALMECIFNFGIVGTLLLLVIVYKVFKNYKIENDMDSILIYIYIFSILGMVEVTINITFIALLAMINNGKVSLEGEKCDR